MGAQCNMENELSLDSVEEQQEMKITGLTG